MGLTSRGLTCSFRSKKVRSFNNIVDSYPQSLTATCPLFLGDLKNENAVWGASHAQLFSVRQVVHIQWNLDLTKLYITKERLRLYKRIME